jgi:hypothetical protein
MTTPNTEIGAITLRAMRAKLEEAAAIARAAGAGDMKVHGLYEMLGCKAEATRGT